MIGYFFCLDKDLQDMKFSMSRHSVLCRDSEALRCVGTRLDTHDKDALSRQKKKKKKIPEIWGVTYTLFSKNYIYFV